MRGIASKGNTVAFGDFGLATMEPKWLTDRQIEAAGVAILRKIHRGGKRWIRVSADKPITNKPARPRRGKGKGEPAG